MKQLLQIQANGDLLTINEDDGKLKINTPENKEPIFTFNPTPGGLSQAEAFMDVLSQWLRKG